MKYDNDLNILIAPHDIRSKTRKNNNNNNNNNNCRVTICGPSPNYMGSWSYEPNTMNL